MKKSELEDYVKVIAKEVMRIGKVADSHTNTLSTIIQSMSQPQEIKLFEPLGQKRILTLNDYLEVECK